MYIYFKRSIDVVLSIFLLIILFPLLIIIGFFVKIDSPGPIIFSQERVGKNKKLFEIYKFRTMYKDSPRKKATRDFKNVEEHITPLGFFLRQTSLDELPQLVNILKGEMSFVGPRPVIPEEEDLVEARNKYNVYSALPGVTGWAQINGRDLVTVEQKAIMDEKYVKNITFIIDIKILLLTVWTVIKRDGFFEGKK